VSSGEGKRCSGIGHSGELGPLDTSGWLDGLGGKDFERKNASAGAGVCRLCLSACPAATLHPAWLGPKYSPRWWLPLASEWSNAQGWPGKIRSLQRAHFIAPASTSGLIFSLSFRCSFPQPPRVVLPDAGLRGLVMLVAPFRGVPGGGQNPSKPAAAGVCSAQARKD
jgi:hypothetical protein